jgi:hypothetical protein
MTKSSTCNKGKALHISQWIKGELGGGVVDGGSYGPSGGGNSGGSGYDDDDLELWSTEQMNAKQAEIERRLSSAAAARDGVEAIIEYANTETISVVSSPDDSQVSIMIL